MVTCGPISANAPISTSAASCASSLTIAVGWIRAIGLLRPFCHDADHFRLGHHYAVDGGDAAHADGVRTSLKDCALQPELIAGNDGTAEARLVDAAEEKQLALAVVDLAESEHRAALRDRRPRAQAVSLRRHRQGALPPSRRS